MSNTIRVRNKVKEFLASGPKSTTEIKDHINSTTRNGITVQGLGQILSNDPEIIRMGRTKVVAAVSSYTVQVWGLK